MKIKDRILKNPVRKIVSGDGTIYAVGRNRMYVVAGKKDPQYPKPTGRGFSVCKQGAKECARRRGQKY